MNLNDNPIFLTQKRLVRRSGMLAGILIAALIGLSLVTGMIAYLTDAKDFEFQSPAEAGKIFYAWIMGIEALVLVIGGFARVSYVLSNERKAGLWDSNRLTPLKSWQLVTGYWFGPPLREFYMALVLAACGLVVVLLGKLSPGLWLGTQVLILSTALFFGLLAVVVGLAIQKPQNGVAFILLFIFVQFPALSLPKFLVTNFLLPVYGIVSLFRDSDDTTDYWAREWIGSPTFFSLPVYPILLTLALQALIGIFLWRAAIRKTANPFCPPLFRWEAAALFAILVIVQHGLMWGVWHGGFPEKLTPPPSESNTPLLAIIHVGTLLLAAVILGATSPLPESIRISVLRRGSKQFGPIFSSSSVSLALVLVAIAAGALLTQCVFATGDTRKIYVIAVGNLLNFCLIFSLLLEFCRLRFRRRALGFFALGLFIVCGLPFILAGVFASSSIAKASLLAPGVIALADPKDQDLDGLLGMTLAHSGIVILLLLAWLRQWKQLLARTV